MVKDFFYFLHTIGVACSTLKAFFHNDEAAAMQMMANLAYYSGGFGPLDELFVLEQDLNLFKGAIMNGRPLDENEAQPGFHVIPRGDGSFSHTSWFLVQAKLVFEFLNRPQVSRAFVNSKTRVRNYLAGVNQQPDDIWPLRNERVTVRVPGNDHDTQQTMAELWDIWFDEWYRKRQDDVLNWRIEMRNYMYNLGPADLPGCWVVARQDPTQFLWNQLFAISFPEADFHFPDW